jgi:pimeloyl-ACP methyl ester carboxylesterase
MTEADLDYYTAAFEKSGFRGPINRYRCMDLDWEQIPELAGARVTQPALFIAGDKDGVLSFTPMDTMKNQVDKLQVVMIPGAGHWTQQERPDEVNTALISFLDSLP